MMRKWIAIFIVFMAAQLTAMSEESDNLLSTERTMVEAKLAKEPNQVVLAVNGMCCRNCAIGIGKKVCQLGFIDTDALPKGVKVDRKNSLLTVAVKKDETVDVAALARTIRKAGYNLVRLYQRVENGSLEVTEISDDL